ncbi:MAG: hypothetical protein IPO92_17545 [Saprospiraceae bacterium]|nr:hypothetical protein [Saprospiraceae bacterium]
MEYILLQTNQRLNKNPRLLYVIDFIHNHPTWPKNIRITNSSDIKEIKLKIDYLSKVENNTHYFVQANDLLFNDVHIKTNSFVAGNYTFQNFNLYSIAKTRNDGLFIDKQIFGFDIFETIFFHISRYEEYYLMQSDMDSRGMLQEKKQFLVRENLEQIPVVDHLIYCFALSLGLEPKKARTQKTISHDIDHLHKYHSFLHFLRLQAGILKRGHFSKFFTQLTQYIQKINPYDSFDVLLSKKNVGEKYIFYHMGGHSKYDVKVDTKDTLLWESLALAKERGYQIGLHPGYESIIQESLLSEEKKRLESLVGGEVMLGRNHYLKFVFPQALEALANVGITNDHSIGYNRRIGFRCGTGFPYKLFNVAKNTITNITEHPLIIMDQCLIELSLLLKKDMKDIHASFLHENEFFTLISYNFHNSIFDFAEMRGLDIKTIYVNLIEH